MEAVYGWVKSIVYYMIFLSVANNLLADSKYEKYVRFFAGMVLILLVISPFTGSLRLDEQISTLFQSITFQNDAQDLKADLLGMEDKRLEQILDRYEEAVKSDLAAMAEAEGLSCVEAQVTIDSDRDSSRYGQVTDIRLEIRGEEQERAERGTSTGSRPVNVEGGEIQSILVEPVILGEAELGMGEASPGEETPGPEIPLQGGETGDNRPLEGQGGESRDNRPLEDRDGKNGAGEGQGPLEKTQGADLRTKINGLTGKVAGYYGLERSDIEVWWKDD